MNRKNTRTLWDPDSPEMIGKAREIVDNKNNQINMRSKG